MPSRSTCSGRHASPSCSTSSAERGRQGAAPRRRVDVLRRRQSSWQGTRGARVGRAVRPRVELAGRGHRGADGCAATTRRRAASPSSSSSSARRHAASSAPPGPRRSPPRPSSCANAGSRDRLIEAGRARAGERRLARRLRLHEGARRTGAHRHGRQERGAAGRRPVPISIVRPSIIESSWAEPKPGWIRGFRMAEPVIISYARGLLREFPGVPEGTVDVIPVDLVVAALITVAALGPEEAPPISQVASGRRSTRSSTRRSSTTSAAGSPSTRSTTRPGSRSSCPSGASRVAAGSRDS